MGFLLGAVASAAAGIIGMSVAVRANIRTAEAGRKNLNAALQTAFRGGTVTGLLVVGLALGSVTIFYAIFRDVGALTRAWPLVVRSSRFSPRIGGGIYTKAADVGADLVGKVEAGFPEDDPRNPAVIADNVGDNVGDCAGMAADLFETYAVTAIAAMLLGDLVFEDIAGFNSETAVVYPLVLGAVSIFASIIGTLFVKAEGGRSIMYALYRGVVVAAVLAVIAFLPVTAWMMGDNGTITNSSIEMFKWLEFGMSPTLKLFFASTVGIFVTVGIIAVSEYYTSTSFRASSGLSLKHPKLDTQRTSFPGSPSR